MSEEKIKFDQHDRNLQREALEYFNQTWQSEDNTQSPEPVIEAFCAGAEYQHSVEQPQQSPVKTFDEIKDEICIKKFEISYDQFFLDFNEYRRGKWMLEEICDEAAELYRSQPVPVTEGRGWISVKDRLPEPGVRVRAIRTYGNGKMEETHTIYVERIETFDDLLCDIITHWQPIVLPSPPKH